MNVVGFAVTRIFFSSGAGFCILPVRKGEEILANMSIAAARKFTYITTICHPQSRKKIQKNLENSQILCRMILRMERWPFRGMGRVAVKK